MPDREPLHWSRWEDQGWAAQLQVQGGADTCAPLWTVPTRTGQIMPSRKCLEIRQVCWPPPRLARANTALRHLPSNNGALWQPSRACLVADLLGQTPGQHPLSAYSFSLSGTWPKLPLWPEQERGVSWYPQAGTSAPAALLGGARPTGTTHLSSPQFPSGTPHASRWPKGSRIPPLQVEGTGWGCCEEEVDQESPRPDPWLLLLRVLFWESSKDWFQGLGSSQLEDAIPQGGVGVLGLRGSPPPTAPGPYLCPTGQRTGPTSSSAAGPARAPWCRSTGAPPPGCWMWPPPPGSGPPAG